MGLMDNRCVIHVIDQDIQDHLREYISSKINEVIRAVLNSLLFFFFFFYKKILHAPKAPKAPKASKAQRAPKAPTAPKAQKARKAHKCK